jgi:hypothetical protein
MSKFKVGDKIRCIDAIGTANLKEGGSMSPYRENDNIPIPITKPAFWIRYGVKLAVVFFIAIGLGTGGSMGIWKMKQPSPPDPPTLCIEEVKSTQSWNTTCPTNTKVEWKGDYTFVCRCKENK